MLFESPTQIIPKTCELCHKDFWNESFLNIHKLNEHGNYNEAFNDSLKLPNRNGKIWQKFEPNKVEISNNTDKLHESTPKMPDLVPISSQYENPDRDVRSQNKTYKANEDDTRRAAKYIPVFCDICQKKLCNKYFLVHHKQKKHGISPSNSTSDKVSSTKT